MTNQKSLIFSCPEEEMNKYPKPSTKKANNSAISRSFYKIKTRLTQEKSRELLNYEPRIRVTRTKNLIENFKNLQNKSFKIHEVFLCLIIGFFWVLLAFWFLLIGLIGLVWLVEASWSSNSSGPHCNPGTSNWKIKFKIMESLGFFNKHSPSVFHQNEFSTPIDSNDRGLFPTLIFRGNCNILWNCDGIRADICVKLSRFSTDLAGQILHGFSEFGGRWNCLIYSCVDFLAIIFEGWDWKGWFVARRDTRDFLGFSGRSWHIVIFIPTIWSWPFGIRHFPREILKF